MIPKINVYQNKLTNPKFSFVAIIILTGSVFENNIEKGISHFIEHLIFKGSKYSTNIKNLNNKLNSQGMNVNAFTNNYITCFHISTPNKYINEAITTLIQMIFNPLFRDEDIMNERKVVINELIERLNNPISFAIQKSNQIIYDKTNPLYHPVIGYINILEKIDRLTILSYYQKFYVPQNIIFFTNTFINKTPIIKIWEKEYLKYSQTTQTSENIISQNTPKLFKLMKKSLTLYNKPGEFNLSKHFPTNKSIYVIINYIIPKCNLKQEIAFDIFTNYLAGGLSSSLFIELRERKQLIYSISSYANIGIDILALTIQFNCKKNKKIYEECINLINKEIKNFFKNGMPIKEFKKFKNKTLFNYIRSESSGNTKMGQLIDKYLFDIPKYNYKKEILSITNTFLHKTINEKMNSKETKKYIIRV